MGEPLRPIAPSLSAVPADHGVPPAWREFMRYCRELGHGDIERLKIQDGVPVLAEVTRQKVRFGPDR